MTGDIDKTAIQTLSRDLLIRARKKDRHIVSAESCTGGMITAALTDIAGSSDVVEGGLVTYSNAMKTALLGVDAGLINQEGAVSAKVAGEMAKGALLHAKKANMAIAVTGVAGPGASEDKPAGLVYFALLEQGDENPQIDRQFFKAMDREQVRRATVHHAFLMMMARL